MIEIFQYDIRTHLYIYYLVLDESISIKLTDPLEWKGRISSHILRKNPEAERTWDRSFERLAEDRK